MRRPVEELEPVPDGEYVLRLIHPRWYNHDAPEGDRVTTAALPQGQWPPTEQSYGPSLFAEAALSGGVSALEAAEPRWKDFGIARVQVGELRKFGVDVRRSPDDCAHDGIRQAHVTLLGVKNKDIRDDVVEFWGKNVVRAPTKQNP